MTSTSMHDGRVVLHNADCRDVLRGMPDNSIDSVVTDPPYALVSIVKRFGKPGSAPAKGNEAYQRASAGFMGKSWDTGEVAFSDEFWAEVLRVLKPGGHVVAFSGTRTYHRMAVAIEDAGFEIRDQLGWLYGSGFPKSHDVSKGIDKAAGAERKVVGENPNHRAVSGIGYEGVYAGGNTGAATVTAPATDAAREWQGWGTALKPAWEPICLARKPLIGTVAANVLEHGTGALNIDGCRVESDDDTARTCNGVGESSSFDMAASGERRVNGGSPLGRWPANIVHDGSDEVLAAFPDTKSGSRKAGEYGLMGYHGADAAPMPAVDGDSGSASRFFYCAKASRADRDAGLESTDGKRANIHPTVKPVSLCQWLCRLVTPPGGVILDPFMGSGSTGKGAVLEGFQFVGVEREEEYMPIAISRIAWAIGASGKEVPVIRVEPVVPPANDLFSGAANDNGKLEVAA